MRVRHVFVQNDDVVIYALLLSNIFLGNNPRVTVQFPIAFFSLFGDFSGKGEVIQKWFSQWTTTSKRFHPKIPTRSKVMAVLKWGTSGAIYFLSTWFQRVFMTLLLLSPEKGVGNKKNLT